MIEKEKKASSEREENIFSFEYIKIIQMKLHMFLARVLRARARACSTQNVYVIIKLSV